jgi:hypothetical protein
VIFKILSQGPVTVSSTVLASSDVLSGEDFGRYLALCRAARSRAISQFRVAMQPKFEMVEYRIHGIGRLWQES